jgi:hypothetical protein
VRVFSSTSSKVPAELLSRSLAIRSKSLSSMPSKPSIFCVSPSSSTILWLTKLSLSSLSSFPSFSVPNSTLLYGGYGLIDSLMDEDEHEHQTDTESSSVPLGFKKASRKSVMVLTGSNASGKSVYGKGVALIVYM